MLRSLLPLALLITACSGNTPQLTTTTFGSVAMKMPYKIIVGAPLLPDELATLQAAVSATFDEVNATYNNWNPQSEISAFNNGITTTLSPSLIRLLNITDEAVILTEGRFDPTVEPLRLLWNSFLADNSTPPAEAIAQTMEAVGWHHLEIGSSSIHKKHPSLRIDLCGIAKGFAVDLISEQLIAAGYHHFYVEWGGDIRVSGLHPTGRPWRVFIAQFENTQLDDAIATVELQDEAIATSGDYIHNWGTETGYYSHIIDPSTGWATPLSPERVSSATVTAPSCALADALATAALLFDTIEDAQTWAKEIEEKYPTVRFWFASRTHPKPSVNHPLSAGIRH